MEPDSDASETATQIDLDVTPLDETDSEETAHRCGSCGGN